MGTEAIVVGLAKYHDNRLKMLLMCATLVVE